MFFHNPNPNKGFEDNDPDGWLVMKWIVFPTCLFLSFVVGYIGIVFTIYSMIEVS